MRTTGLHSAHAHVTVTNSTIGLETGKQILLLNYVRNKKTIRIWTPVIFLLRDTIFFVVVGFTYSCF